MNTSASRSVISVLLRERKIGCFLAQNNTLSYPFPCFYSLKRKVLIEEIINYSKEILERFGRIRIYDLLSFAKEYKISSSVWPSLILRHYFYEGWGELADDNTLNNPIILKQ